MAENAEAVPKPSPEQRISAILNPEPPPQENAPQEGEQEAVAPAQAPVTEPETAEPPAEQVGPADASEQEVIEIGGTIQDIAEHLGVEVSELYENVNIPVTDPEGVRHEITLSEWKDSYQNTQKLAKAQTALAEQQQAVETARQQLEQGLATRLQEAGGMVAAVEAALLKDMEKVNWDTLRVEAPDEWAAKRQELLERQNQLREMKAGVSAEMQRVQTEYVQRTQADQQQLLERERTALLAAIPEWSNQEVRERESAEMTSYLTGSGFTPEQIAQGSDHRVMVMARKAMLYDKTVSSADAAKKRVVRIGKKVLKSGAKQAKAEVAQDQLATLRQRVKKTGRFEDAAALISQLRSGD